MHTGTLYFDNCEHRYGIRYKDKYGESEYNFHCGDCLDIKLNDVWIPTRMEMGGTNEWYLVGIPGMIGVGATIRA